MRLIDADALFKEMEKSAWYNNADRDEVAEVLVMNAPTIEERKDVVRCKDCKRAETFKCPMYSSKWFYTDDDYCSNGERREE